MLDRLMFFFIGMAAAFLIQALWWGRVARRLGRRPSMNGYNFTERVRRSLAIAREEASALHAHYVGPEHILLGLLRTEGVAVAILNNLKVDLVALRTTVIAGLGEGATSATGPDLPYTSRAKKVLEHSMGAARDLNHNYVGTEHVLLGLIREGDNGAAKALANAGVTSENARAHIVSLRQDEKP